MSDFCGIESEDNSTADGIPSGFGVAAFVTQGSWNPGLHDRSPLGFKSIQVEGALDAFEVGEFDIP